MRRAPVALVASLALGAATITGCGSDSLDEGGSSGEGSSSSGSGEVEVSVNQELADKVPQEIKDKGTLTIGTDASYAPNEFLAEDGKTVQGFDVDLFDAVAASLDLETKWQPAKFDSIITGVDGGKYDMGISSFTINDERKKQVNMISYFNAGTQWAAAPGNPENVDPEAPCGLTVAVQKGTVQQEEDLPAKEDECKSEGEPIEVLVYEGQDQATAAVGSGKADAMLADSPIVAYAVKQSDGKIEAVGDIYDAAPYGYVVPQDDEELAELFAEALTALKEDGAYDSVLEEWGVQDGGIDEFDVNP